MVPIWKYRTLNLANKNIQYEQQAESALVLQSMIQLKNDLSGQNQQSAQHVQKHIDKIIQQTTKIDIPLTYMNLYKQRVQNDLINNKKLIQQMIGQDNDWLKSWNLNETLIKQDNVLPEKDQKPAQQIQANNEPLEEEKIESQ